MVILYRKYLCSFLFSVEFLVWNHKALGFLSESFLVHLCDTAIHVFNNVFARDNAFYVDRHDYDTATDHNDNQWKTNF